MPREREWADLLNGRNPGCFITKKALDREYIGYMYHEEPQQDGWKEE